MPADGIATVFFQFKHFHSSKYIKIVIYGMAAILFRTQYVDSIDSGLDHLC